MVSVGPPKVGEQKRLVYLAGRADGIFPSKRWPSVNRSGGAARRVFRYGAALIAPSAHRLIGGSRACDRVGGSTSSRFASPTRGAKVASPANPFKPSGGATPRRTGDAAMTRTYQRISRAPIARGRTRASSSISTSCAKTIAIFATRAAGHARLLRRQGQSGARDPQPARRARLVASTRPRSPRSSLRWRPARRRTASASATRSRRRRDIARAYALGVRLFAVDCEAEVEKIARAAPGAKVFCRILCDGAGAEWPLSRKFGCAPEMAAARARARPCARPRRAWPVVPCRLAAAQPAHVGPRAEGLGRDLPRARRARHPAADAQPRRRLPDALSQGCAARCAPTARRSSARCASISATAFRRRSSSRDAAWSATPESSRPRWC